MKTIFVVTMLTDIEYYTILASKGKEKGYDERRVGWFDTLQEAESCLKTNCGDVHEGHFDYAVIEEVGPGFYAGAIAVKTWYEWNQDLRGYENIKEPKQWHGIGAIGLG